MTAKVSIEGRQRLVNELHYTDIRERESIAEGPPFDAVHSNRNSYNRPRHAFKYRRPGTCESLSLYVLHHISNDVHGIPLKAADVHGVLAEQDFGRSDGAPMNSQPCAIQQLLCLPADYRALTLVPHDGREGKTVHRIHDVNSPIPHYHRDQAVRGPEVEPYDCRLISHCGNPLVGV